MVLEKEMAVPCIRTVATQGNSACYEIEPVETGYSVSLANALRRVLLSSLPGAAVTSVLIEGVQHEFQDILHVKEDVPDIVQQLKKIRLRSFASRDVHIYLDAQGEGRVTAGDIRTSDLVEIVNPALHVATLDNEDARLAMDMTVGTGRGFVEACVQAERRTEGQPIGLILVDAIYSPVVKVNFTVEHVRVGRVEQLDKVTMEITTDGTISPDEALRESVAILRRQFEVFAYGTYYVDVPAEHEKHLSDVPIPQHIYDISIDELDLYTRVTNSLKRDGITKVGHVLQREGTDLMALRNIGEKAMQDIYGCLKGRGLLPTV